MSAKVFRVLGLAGAALVTATGAYAQTPCADAFATIDDARALRAVSKSAPKLMQAKELEKLGALLSTDSRMGALEAAEYSSTFDSLLDLTNPGSLREWVFSSRIDAQVKQSLVIGRSLLGRIKMPDAVMHDVLKEAERQMDIAISLVVGAARAAGQEAKATEWMWQSKAYKKLMLEAIYSELRAARGLAPEPLFPKDVSLPDAVIPEWEITSRSGKTPFSEAFLNEVNASNQSLPDVLRSLSVSARSSLEAMPAGISLKPVEAVSTVRFGGHHYYGNYRNYRVISRDAYVRKGAPLFGGLKVAVKKFTGSIDAELNVSRAQKRIVSVLLDKNHKTLDPFSPLCSAEKGMLQTCGMYPNFTFIRAGFPVIAPGYIHPESGMVSLALQRIFRIPTVKKFSTENLSPGTMVVGPIVAYLHGYNGLKMFEGTIYVLAYTKGKWVWQKLSGEFGDDEVPAEGSPVDSNSDPTGP
jgi:hypothetical protein